MNRLVNCLSSTGQGCCKAISDTVAGGDTCLARATLCKTLFLYALPSSAWTTCPLPLDPLSALFMAGVIVPAEQPCLSALSCALSDGEAQNLRCREACLRAVPVILLLRHRFGLHHKQGAFKLHVWQARRGRVKACRAS
jgi:hypothetical protein